MYLIRLDDAADYMNTSNWKRIENLFNTYSVKPLVGVIPKIEDEEIISKHSKNNNLWEDVKMWESLGWDIAMHGYNHVFQSYSGGINPVNYYSEFAGVDINIQREKIKKGLEIFSQYNINPKVFFAPAHTFDKNTLKVLLEESNIRVISDTFASNTYKRFGFHFIPQQVGKPKKLPFKVVTICLHPNNMTDVDFKNLEDFIIKYKNKITSLNNIKLRDSKMKLIDKILNKLYFSYRKLKNRSK